MKLITVRYKGRCHGCPKTLHPGAQAWAAPELDPTGGSVPVFCDGCAQVRRNERAQRPRNQQRPGAAGTQQGMFS